MITRRTFWKKTVGVATAAIAVVSGKSAKADESQESMPSLSEDVAPVENILYPVPGCFYDGISEASKGNWEEFAFKGRRWMRVYDRIVPFSLTIKHTTRIPG